jgi:signal transduction histidine kinase
MEPDLLDRLSIGSTVGELPGVEDSFAIEAKAGEIGELFARRPEIAGVLVTSGGQVTSAVSRRYYLDTIGRHLGQEVYNPRPLSVLLRRFQELGGALALAADTAIPDAVRRGLARRRELLYEPVILAAGNARPTRLLDFEDLLLADSRVTQLRNAQMRQILGTVHEGLLLVGRDHRIATEHSVSAHTIFRSERIGGRALESLLAEGLDAERCALAGGYVDTLFDHRVIEALVTKINPLLRVEAGFGGGRQVLEFRFARGIEAGRIEHLLVRVEDVTRRELLARELEAQRERADQRLALAMALTQADPGEVHAFLGSVEEEVRSLASAAADLPSGDGLATHARVLHRLKGEAGLLRLSAFEVALHRAEDALRAPVGRGPDPDRLHPVLLALEGLRGDAGELIDRFGRLATSRAAEVAPTRGARHDAPPPVTSWDELGRALGELGQRIALDLRKQARIRLTGDGERVPAALRPLLRDLLVQLVRNAVAHGIEEAAARQRAGKEIVGLVQVALRLHDVDGWVECIVQDDGRGLDIEALRRRAAALGLAVPSDPRQLIFQPGFSTAGEAHLHAGRGAGLDLVRTLVEERGGRIEVHSEAGRYCAFQVVLPLAVEVAA